MDRQLFQNSNLATDERLTHLTKEAGTYQEPPPTPASTVLGDDQPPTASPNNYQQLFDDLQREIHSKRDTPTTAGESERLAFTYKTLAMLKELNNSAPGNGNTDIDSVISCGCNQKVTPSELDNVSHTQSTSSLPLYIGKDLDNDTDDEDVRSTMSILSKIMSESPDQ